MGLWLVRRLNNMMGIQFFLVVLLGFSSVQAYAVVADHFFQSEQMVENQSAKNRRYAIKKGFEEVLTKLAGSRDIILRPELRVALQNPRSYLQKFTYFETEESESSWIRLNFNGAQIEDVFYEMKLPLWSKDRPAVMIWFGIDNGQLGRDIISNTNPRLSNYKALFDAEAQRRGLTLMWPKLDEQDQMTVSITDLWSMDMTAMTNASRRYAAQLILLGKVNRSPSGQWYGQWGLEFEGRAQWSEGTGQSLPTVAKKVIDGVARELSSMYAIEVGHDVVESLLLEIHDVNALKDYAEISTLLESLLPVSHFALKEAIPGRVQFEVEVQGGQRQLLSSLKLQRRLRAMPQTYATPVEVTASELALEESQELQAERSGEASSDEAEAAAVESARTVIKYRWL